MEEDDVRFVFAARELNKINQPRLILRGSPFGIGSPPRPASSRGEREKRGKKKNEKRKKANTRERLEKIQTVQRCHLASTLDTVDTCLKCGRSLDHVSISQEASVYKSRRRRGRRAGIFLSEDFPKGYI